MTNNHLIVGIGGSGGKIIRQIKKRAKEYEKSNPGNNFPKAYFEYLYIDTSDSEISDTNSWRVLGEDVSLGTSQYRINRADNIKPVLDNPSHYPGLAPWIQPTSVFDNYRNSTEGAAQKRKLGRLVFAQNASEFIKALGVQMDTLVSKGGGINEATIHVVCGLAGGTGSGSIVDVVAQIRNKYDKEGTHRIIVYAILPEAHSRRSNTVSGPDHYYANGYAAIAELNQLAINPQYFNVLNGELMSHAVYFNSCYLIDSENDRSVKFNIDSDVPQIIADFIYQKALNNEWKGLGYTERLENIADHFETEDGIPVRTKRFLSFGINRVVVPAQEITEYLSYDFSAQVMSHLMFNNFHENVGYASRPAEKDWGATIRQGSIISDFLLSDSHLMLESGILEEDINTKWKPIAEYWKVVVNSIAPEIQNNKNNQETAWSSILNVKLNEVFNTTYRGLSGVSNFYEVKSTIAARQGMAKCIRRKIETDMFRQWQLGDISLSDLREEIDQLVLWLDEREKAFNSNASKIQNDIAVIGKKIAELGEQINNVGLLSKLITDKRHAIYASMAQQYQEFYIAKTRREGYKFASMLIPLVREQLLELRERVDQLLQNIAKTFEKINQEHQLRLGNINSDYQERKFDIEKIKEVAETLKKDLAGQKVRIKKVRDSLVGLAGVDSISFDRLCSISIADLMTCVFHESSDIIIGANAELPKDADGKVLNENIVERLSKEFSANSDSLRAEIKRYNQTAGYMCKLDKNEVARRHSAREGGPDGVKYVVGVFLPKCKSKESFREKIVEIIHLEKDNGVDLEVIEGKLETELTFIKIVALLQARFVGRVKDLKWHYDKFLQNDVEKYLMHCVSDGSKLSPLYVTDEAVALANKRRLPNLVLARLLGLVKSRVNKYGVTEWVFECQVEGLPDVSILSGKIWNDVLNSDQDDVVYKKIDREVTNQISENYKHVDRKAFLYSEFTKLVTEIFTSNGNDDQNKEFLQHKAMSKLIKIIIGIE